MPIGSARIPIQVDLGVGDAITPESVLMDFPTVFELPDPTLQSYPRETLKRVGGGGNPRKRQVETKNAGRRSLVVRR